MSKKRNKNPYPWKNRDIRWEKLDNTAHLFPVIAGENMTSVYRISISLGEEIDPELLQQALDMVLPRFPGFDLRLRSGLFWQYFEENGKLAPRVQPENSFPCRYIRPNRNNNYLFRVTYYKCRINLEVFHVLTDGMGGLNFIRELCYQYLRLRHKELQELMGDAFHADTSLNREDSFLKNYRRKAKRGYKSKRACLIRGEKLSNGALGVMHGYVELANLKTLCKGKGLTVNEYLISCFIHSVYTEYLNSSASAKPIRVAVPVNLRPYFNSITGKNFFVVVSVEFQPTCDSHSFDEIAAAVKSGMKQQLERENLEKLMGYNVANEKSLWKRLTPLPLKYLAMAQVYHVSALANTTTITNIGTVPIAEEYRPYIKSIHAFLPTSKGQPIRSTVCSYEGRLCFTFSYNIKGSSVQRGFFRRMSQDGLDVSIETNGVSYE